MPKEKTVRMRTPMPKALVERIKATARDEL